MSILEVELEAEMAQRLQQVAAKQGRSAGDLVRAALEKLLETEDAGQLEHSVMEFHGAGREAMKDLDVKKYVRELRDEWDR